MFGQYIKSIRLEKNVGSRELAKKINKASAYVSQLERGLIKNPDYETARLILLNLNFSNSEVEGILDSYNITAKQKNVAKETITLSSNLMTNDKFEEKCKQGALEILNVINSLPEKTKEILLELL